jgi:hypothetical protein
MPMPPADEKQVAPQQISAVAAAREMLVGEGPNLSHAKDSRRRNLPIVNGLLENSA